MPQTTKKPSAIATEKLLSYRDQWLCEGEIRQHSATTQANRRLYLNNLHWFLSREGIECCDAAALRQFFAYLAQDHTHGPGRWGNPNERGKVKPSTIATYHRHIATFFSFLVKEEIITTSPMERVPKPSERSDQIQPFTDDQIRALLDTARRSRHPKRDQAILLLLLDTGLRSSELCNLTFADLDIDAGLAYVVGKGNKRRAVPFSSQTKRALWKYLEVMERNPEEPVFYSERGDPLTRSGLQQLIERLGLMARLTGVRCSPHTWRHTFAVNYLRAHGDALSLQTILGHHDIKMTQRYVQFAGADIQAKHHQHSPVRRLLGSR